MKILAVKGKLLGFQGASVLKGFNSDVEFDGRTYHVQTEDWGQRNPFLVSRVFLHGAVLRTLKTSYTDVLPEALAKDKQALHLAMELQHQKILDLLLSGKLVN